MSIEREEAVGMIKDYNESVAFQPVRIDDRARHDGVDAASLGRPDLDSLPLYIRIECRMLLPTEVRHHIAFRGPGQASPHPARSQCAGRGLGSRSPTAILQLTQKAVDAGGGAFQLL